MTDIYRKSITEHRVEGRPLGRHILHDPRSRDYTADQAATIQDVWHRAYGLPLTQSRGSCTAEALCGALDSVPDFTGQLYEQADADKLYDVEIELEGGDPQTDDPGGTGIMVSKAAVKLGWISSYRWCFSIDSSLKALALAPVITGVNWYEGMDGPDSHGFVEISGDVRGGHEFLVDVISLERKAVGCWNSWGPDWGPWGGRFWLRLDDWERLLHEDGDVTVPAR